MRTKLVFIMAIIFGLISSLLIMNYLKDIKDAMDSTEYVEIVIANQNIPAKTIIGKEMLTIKKIPSKFKHVDEVIGVNELAGKILLIPITKGESILKNQVLSIGDSKEGLAYIIPKGRRALTLEVDEVTGVAGLIKPGDRIDVIGTVVIGENEPKPYTLVVLQDIEVLAVGQQMNDTESEKPIDVKTVTVAVTVEEAKPLVMASQRGVIRLMLRSPIDNSKGSTVPFKLENFLY